VAILETQTLAKSEEPVEVMVASPLQPPFLPSNLSNPTYTPYKVLVLGVQNPPQPPFLPSNLSNPTFLQVVVEKVVMVGILAQPI